MNPDPSSKYVTTLFAGRKPASVVFMDANLYYILGYAGF